MSRFIAAFVLCLGRLCAALAQEGDPQAVPRNAILAEIWFSGAFAGIDYQRVWLNTPMTQALISAGVRPRDDLRQDGKYDPDLTVPIGAHLCLGRIAQFELGGGAMLFSDVIHNSLNTDTRRQNQWWGWACAGVRAGERSGGIFARAAFVPIFKEPEAELTVSVALGIRF